MAAPTVGTVGEGAGVRAPATPPAPGPAVRPPRGRVLAGRGRVEVGRLGWGAGGGAFMCREVRRGGPMEAGPMTACGGGA